MPTYDYFCKDCSHEFEEFQKMSDALLEVCPKCNGKLQRKIGGGAGLHFKGSGFYCTDYRSSSYEKDKKKDISVSKESCPKNSSCKKCEKLQKKSN